MDGQRPKVPNVSKLYNLSNQYKVMVFGKFCLIATEGKHFHTMDQDNFVIMTNGPSNSTTGLAWDRREPRRRIRHPSKSSR